MLPQEPFDYWNIIKKRLHFLPHEPFFREGEIWWCSIGNNIGHESNGKHENFERPVLILIRINSHMAYVLPITSNCIEDKYRVSLNTSQVVLSQIRTVSARRFLRKMETDRISSDMYSKIVNQLILILQNAKLRFHQFDEAEKCKDLRKSTI